jgi:hypothetical protein
MSEYGMPQAQDGALQDVIVHNSARVARGRLLRVQGIPAPGAPSLPMSLTTRKVA